MSSNFIIKQNSINPTFKNAQVLFNSYSTLQSKIVLRNILINTLDSKTLDSFNTQNTREIYNNIILKYYPNELSVKSSFINQVLFKANNHVTIFELPIGSSRIDLCKLNGSSVAFEIKTDLDNLLRLNKQLNDYLEIFEKVYVICSLNKLPDIEKETIPICGIYTYSISKNGNYKFNLYRQALTSKNLNPEKQLNILRKQEITKNFTDAPFTNREDTTSLILQKYTITKINEIFKEAIKSRYQNQWDFLRNNKTQILEIDYQWFFKNTINPDLIYS
jgi:hypothetical protein